MSFSLSQKPDGRRIVENPPSVEITYTGSGEDDDDVVMALSLSSVPLQTSSPFGVLYRSNVDVSRRGYRLHDVTATFSQKKYSNGEWRLTFDGSGGTRTQYYSYGTTRYPSTIPDNGGLIGVDHDTKEVKGIEVIEPSCKVNVLFKFSEGQFDQNFINLVTRQTGKINSRRFLGWRPGEVLFVAPGGSEGSESETEVNFQFYVSENITNQTIAGISGISKRGWDAIEPYAITQNVANVTVKKPTGFYVHKVYREADFASIFGFGG